MTPLETEYTNMVLGPPNNWNAAADGPCYGLPVLMDESDGLPRFYSYWRMTWRERLAVFFGRPVRLCVCGRSHPPVHLDTELI